MKAAIIGAVAIAIIALRVGLRQRRRTSSTRTRRSFTLFGGDIGLVASREIRERVRGRIFRVGTVLILAIVAGAIIIPALNKSSAPTSERVGVVGTLAPSSRAIIQKDATLNGDVVHFVTEPNVKAASRAVSSGSIIAAFVGGDRIIVESLGSSSNESELEQIAQDLGIINAVSAAHLSASQIATLNGAHALKITSLVPSKSSSPNVGTSVIGLILIFMMLSQYNTWTLIGVMEEKSSRVIEVLLSAVRPLQLLTGKVLGIGLVAFAQATLVVAVALIIAKSVGSSLLHGAAPVEVASILVWLMLGYAFYCWVYAAAGSMAERQDQIQTLALPLSIPLIFGYVVSLTAASSSHASLLIRVLGYLPPTAPFAMPVLVGLGAVTWWEFLASVAISIVSTVLVARFAAQIYRRAILRTGGRVRVREVFRAG